MQFEKKLIPCLRTVMRQVQTQEQTQEVRLPDGMPDIGRVISAWGQTLVRGKEWRSSGMNISGGVMMWVLYAPEDGSHPQCIEAWLPFHLKWEFPGAEQDGTILASALLRSVDARSTSARKIMCRATVSVLGEAVCPGEATLYEAPELPEDMHILKNQYVMCVPVEAGEKAFSVEETLPLPESMPAPARLLRYELCADVTEQRLLTDKLLFRGIGVVHLLYADADGQLHSWETEVPFSQYTELNREYSEDAKTTVCMAVTNLELRLDDNGSLLLKAGLTGQYTVFDCVKLPIVEDAYSTVRPVRVHTTQLQLPAVLDTVTEMITAQADPEQTEDTIVDVAFYPEHGSVYHEDDQMITEMSGNFHFLCADSEGQLYSQQKPWSDSWRMGAADSVRSDAMLTPVGKWEDRNETAAVRMRLDVKTMGTEGMNVVTGLEMGDMQTPDPDRPSLILCAAGQDRLWDVAKRTGSTVEAIMQANGLQQEPGEDQILLIPVL